jgi:tetratricopeptide (TPR) repeat protein
MVARATTCSSSEWRTLISRLSGSTELRVLTLSAVEGFPGRTVEARRAGRALGVDYVVDGSVQRQQGRIRVNARMLGTADGRTLWAGTFDESPERIFTVQDEMAERMASALALGHTPQVRHRSACDGSDAQAYRAYLRGRHLMTRPERSALPKALEALQLAVARDPECARAWAAIAFTLRALAMTADGPPVEVFTQAKAAVGNALRIDPDSAEAHASKGFIEFWYDWDWLAAERSLRHAIELKPDSAEAHFALAHLLNNTGRLDEALHHARRATALDPMAPIINAVSASFFINGGQAEEGDRRLQQVLQTDPEFWVALHLSGVLKLRAGQYDEAAHAFERASASCGGCSVAEAMRGRVHALRGERDAAADILGSLERRRGDAYVPATRVAVLHLSLGDQAAAIRELQLAHSERDLHMTFLAIDPVWRPLYGDPAFQSLVRALDSHLPSP